MKAHANRIYSVFGIVLVLSIIAAWQPTSGSEWDPGEDRPGLLSPQDSASPSTGFDGTKGTIDKWKSTTQSSPTAPPSPGTNPDDKYDVAAPNMAVKFGSVSTGTTVGSTCSISGTNTPKCSVNANGTASQCSAIAGNNTTYCSTGTATGTSGASTCSIQGSLNGGNSCSALAAGTSCSTQSDQTNSTTTTCSATSAGGNTCSTGSQSGVAGGGGTCSALQSTIGQGMNGSGCSVQNSSGATAVTCSADGAGAGFCSVSSGMSTDFCSVSAGQTGTGASCTVIGANTGGAVCSVAAAPANKGFCSTASNNGGNTGPVGGVCVP